MSVLKRLGPRSEFMVRGALPYCPSSGNVQTVGDVLNHCAIFSSCERLLGSVGSPFRFGRCPEQPLPQPVRARSTPENTVIGVPDRYDTMPANRHAPTTMRITAGESINRGSSYIPLSRSTCVRSLLDTPRSAPGLFGSWAPIESDSLATVPSS